MNTCEEKLTESIINRITNILPKDIVRFIIVPYIIDQRILCPHDMYYLARFFNCWLDHFRFCGHHTWSNFYDEKLRSTKPNHRGYAIGNYCEQCSRNRLDVLRMAHNPAYWGPSWERSIREYPRLSGLAAMGSSQEQIVSASNMIKINSRVVSKEELKQSNLAKRAQLRVRIKGNLRRHIDRVLKGSRLFIPQIRHRHY